MQSARKAETVTIKPTVLNTSTSIYDNDHMKGLYRGVTPRIGRRSAWLASLIMVGLHFALSPLHPLADVY